MTNSHVIAVTDETFDAEVLAADRPVLVDFGATWCGPCKALTPVVHKIAEDFAGAYKVVTVDIDDAPKVAARYRIRSAPSLLVFVGGEVKNLHVGLVPRDAILNLLKDATQCSARPA